MSNGRECWEKWAKNLLLPLLAGPSARGFEHSRPWLGLLADTFCSRFFFFNPGLYLLLASYISAGSHSSSL